MQTRLTEVAAGHMAFCGVVRIVAGVVLSLILCMYLVVSAIAGWALNQSIEHMYGGKGGFSAVMGNQATGFFIVFALIAGVVGLGSCILGIYHVKVWTPQSSSSSTVSSVTAWSLTLLAMGLACKEINLGGRNAKLRTLEVLVIILSGVKVLYLIIVYLGDWAGEYSTYTYQDTYSARTTVIVDPEKELATV